MSFLYTHYTYSLILLVSILGLAVVDWRYKLVASRGSMEQRAFAATIGSLLGFFLLWDILGILLGVFFTNTRYTLGLNIVSPNLPIEEVGFLILLIYSVLIAWTGYQRVIDQQLAKVSKNKQTKNKTRKNRS